MFAAILESIEIPLLLSVRRAEHWGRLKGCRVADAVIEALKRSCVLQYLCQLRKAERGLRDVNTA